MLHRRRIPNTRCLATYRTAHGTGATNSQPCGTKAIVRGSGGLEEPHMNSVIYLIGMVVVVLAILSFLGYA